MLEPERTVRFETLRHAVSRKMFCDITGKVLDVRTAVLIETSGQHFVLPGEVWDRFEQRLRDGIAAKGWEVTDVIDGRRRR